MNLDQTLCQTWLGMDAAFWREAQAALGQISSTPAGMVMFNSAMGQIARQNAPEAELACRHLLAHLRLFAPQAAPMATAALLGACLPQTLAALKTRGVPGDILLDTFQNFGFCAGAYEAKHGRPGVDELPWLLYHFTHRMFKIGRLMYGLAPFEPPYHLFENIHTGKNILLANGGQRVTQDGYIEHTNGRKPPTAFTTTLSQANGFLTGHPVDMARGVMQAAPVTLELACHRLVLAPGLPVLALHIPRDGGFQPEAIDASLAAAKTFFAQQGYAYACMVCESWMLDPALEGLAGEQSNLARFMRRFAKYPVFAPNPSFGGYVFGEQFCWPNWQNAPEGTSLQRAIKRHLAAGGELFDTGGILMPGPGAV